MKKEDYNIKENADSLRKRKKELAKIQDTVPDNLVPCFIELQEDFTYASFVLQELEKALDLLAESNKKKAVFLIEKRWIDCFENRFENAMGFKIVGFTTDKTKVEEYKKEKKMYDGWPLDGKHLLYRVTEIKEIR